MSPNQGVIGVKTQLQSLSSEVAEIVEVSLGLCLEVHLALPGCPRRDSRPCVYTALQVHCRATGAHPQPLSPVVFPDAEGMGSGKQPSSAPEGPENGPRHREGSLELSNQEQRHPAGPRKKQSSWDPQEGPLELQAGQDQAMPGSELGVSPSTVPGAQEGLQQQDSGKESEDQQGSRQNPGAVEGQPPYAAGAALKKMQEKKSLPTVFVELVNLLLSS
uniref:Uncharacterized protein n=1 Tax=Catagonus wagneri TaxID=51154 RepID=A0A8C3W3D4_9CETA